MYTCIFLAVGDPYYGVESLEYSGQVYIYTGQLEGSAYSLQLHTTLGIGDSAEWYSVSHFLNNFFCIKKYYYNIIFYYARGPTDILDYEQIQFTI